MVLPLIIGAGLGAGAIIERYGIPLLNANSIRGALVKEPNIDQQIANAVRSKLLASEGYKNKAYLDTLGILTVGIGHKVLPRDGIKLGQTISDARVEQLYAQDTGWAIRAAKNQARELNKYNLDMIVALVEVNFQLGEYWRSVFPNTWSLIKMGRINQAIAAFRKSRWNRQTPNRVEAFVSALQRNYA